MHQGAAHPHHASLAIVTAMLGMFVVLESLALGYVAMRYSERQQAHEVAVETGTTLQDKIEAAKEAVPPLLYVKNKNELMRINRATGTEEKVGSYGGVSEVFAVPQVGYDGRVFLTTSCGECDSPDVALQSLDLKNVSPTLVPFAFQRGNFARGSIAASPDGTKMVAAVYDDGTAFEDHSGKIYIIDLLSGTEQVVGTLAADEYFSEWYGENVLGSYGQFNVGWRDRDCATVYIYKDNPNDPTDATKQHRETRTFCPAE